jgi:hypothetical protein
MPALLIVLPSAVVDPTNAGACWPGVDSESKEFIVGVPLNMILGSRASNSNRRPRQYCLVSRRFRNLVDADVKNPMVNLENSMTTLLFLPAAASNTYCQHLGQTRIYHLVSL